MRSLDLFDTSVAKKIIKVNIFQYVFIIYNCINCIYACDTIGSHDYLVHPCIIVLIQIILEANMCSKSGKILFLTSGIVVRGMTTTEKIWIKKIKHTFLYNFFVSILLTLCLISSICPNCLNYRHN